MRFFILSIATFLAWEALANDFQKGCRDLFRKVIENESLRDGSEEKTPFTDAFGTLLLDPGGLLRERKIPITEKSLLQAINAIHLNGVRHAERLLTQQGVEFDTVEEEFFTPYGEFKGPQIVIRTQGKHELNELARQAHDLLDGLKLRFAPVLLLNADASHDQLHHYNLPLERISNTRIGHIDLHELVHAAIETKHSRSLIAAHVQKEEGQLEKGYEGEFGYGELATYLLEARVFSIALQRLPEGPSPQRERMTGLLQSTLSRIQQMAELGEKNLASFQKSEFKSFRQHSDSQKKKTPQFEVKLNLPNGAEIVFPVWSKEAAEKVSPSAEPKSAFEKFLAYREQQENLSPLLKAESMKALEKLKEGVAVYRKAVSSLSNFQSEGHVFSKADLQKIQNTLREASRSLKPLFESVDPNP